jgi:hypothetical protein
MERPDKGRKRRTWRFKLDDSTILEVSAPRGATEKEVRRRGRLMLVLGSLAAALALAAVAVAGHNVNPTSLTFNATEGGANPPTQTFTFSGPAACTGGTISETASWLSLDKSVIADDDVVTGGVQTTVTASVAVAGLLASGSPFTATVTINPTDSQPGSSEPCDSNLTVSVTLNIVAGDTTAPDSRSVVIDDNAAWTNDGSGDVSVDISATDAVGVTRYRLATSQAGLGAAADFAVSPAETSFARSDLAFTLSAGEGLSKEVWARFCDAADNCADASDTIGWDKTAPSITDAGVQSGTAGANGWYVSAVVNRFQVGSDLSGLDAACTAAFPSGNRDVSTGASEGSSVSVSSGPCSDVAGNTNPGINSAIFKIDLTDPSVEITSPADGLTTIATAITVSGTASDTPSGIDTVSVNGGSATLGTGTFTKTNVSLNCGSNTVTALATDVAGRTRSDSITVNRLCFGLQYLQPIDQSTSSPATNVGKYGRVIPVKVILTLLGGGGLSDADLASYGLTLQMGVNGATCSSGAATDSVEAYADAGESAAGTNLFRWDPSSQHWIYNLDTKAPPGMSMTINSCYRLDVYVSDGTNKVKVSTSTYALFKPIK